jgi:hypothetical protein
MRSKTSHITLLFVSMATMLLFSCKKKTIDPPAGSTSPVFALNGSLDGDDFTIEAGKNNAFMTTFMDMSNGVALFSGRLGADDLFVEMGIYNGDVDIVQPFSLKNFQGNLLFAEACISPLLTLSKNDFPNAQFINEVKWFIDGELAGVNSATISSPGKYNVCALVKFMDQTEATVCNEMIIGYNVNAHCRMHYFMNMQGQLKVWMDEASAPIEYIDWKVDGLASGNLDLLDIYVNQELHTIEAEVHFENGVVRKKSMVIDGSSNGKFIYDFSSLEQSVVNPIKWDYAIVLQVMKDGKLYSSLNADNSESQISITDFSYYGLNAQGKKVYKCIAQINAFLAENGSSTTKHFEGTTTFGVEIP